jgi:hypothetical protein
MRSAATAALPMVAKCVCVCVCVSLDAGGSLHPRRGAAERARADARAQRSLCGWRRCCSRWAQARAPPCTASCAPPIPAQERRAARSALPLRTRAVVSGVAHWAADSHDGPECLLQSVASGHRSSSQRDLTALLCTVKVCLYRIATGAAFTALLSQGTALIVRVASLLLQRRQWRQERVAGRHGFCAPF